MTVQAATERIEAWRLRQGARVLIYGDVPVEIVEAHLLPVGQPARTVKLRYRCDFANDTFVIGQMTVPASQTFPTYDDGSPF